MKTRSVLLAALLVIFSWSIGTSAGTRTQAAKPHAPTGCASVRFDVDTNGSAHNTRVVHATSPVLANNLLATIKRAMFIQTNRPGPAEILKDQFIHVRSVDQGAGAAVNIRWGRHLPPQDECLKTEERARGIFIMRLPDSFDFWVESNAKMSHSAPGDNSVDLQKSPGAPTPDENAAGKVDAPPKLVHHVQPEFPVVDGDRMPACAILQFHVDRGGRPYDIIIRTVSDERYAHAGVAAIAQYRYEPSPRITYDRLMRIVWETDQPNPPPLPSHEACYPGPTFLPYTRKRTEPPDAEP